MSSNILDDWQTTTDILFNDALQLAGQLDQASTGSFRRSYVRAVLAAIEGSTYGMRRVVLEVWKHRQSGLTVEDLELLTDTRVDAKGKSKKRFLPFNESIKFAFGAFAKIHGFTSSANYRVKGWTELINAAEIRHRLMHPKSSADLEVSDDDLDTIQYGADWYFKTRNQLVADATHRLKR